MNIEQESVGTGFSVGSGGADAASKPIVAAGYTDKAYKGVRVRAATANSLVIYVGPRSVTVSNGYPLPAGEEIVIPVDDASKVYVVATPAADSQQTVGLSGTVAGETFTLTFRGQTTAPIAVNANAAAVQSALRALSTIGATGCSVADTGGGQPYTVTFTGPLAKTDVDLMTSTDGGISETQTVTITDAIGTDKLVLTYDGQSTGQLDYDVNYDDAQVALEALSNIGAGNVSVTGGDGDPLVVQFIGDLANTDVPAMTGTCGNNEKQTVTVSGGVSGDKLVLTYGGNSTGEVDYNVSAAGLETALDGIVALNGKTSVTGSGPYVVEFIDTLAGTDVSALSGVCGKNEKQTITVTGGAAGDKMVLTLGADSTSELNYNVAGADLQTALRALTSIGAGNCTVTGDGPYVVEFISGHAHEDMAGITGVCGKNEKQTVAIDDASSGGTFTLTYVDQTTAGIAYSASAADVAAALKLLSNIGDSDVDVTGGPGPSADWVVEFKGALAKTDVAMLVGDGALLTGGSTDVTITETVKGNLATVGVVETVKGNSATVGVVETIKGNTATVGVVETQKGDAAFTITIAKVADITEDTKYSWISI